VTPVAVEGRGSLQHKKSPLPERFHLHSVCRREIAAAAAGGKKGVVVVSPNSQLVYRERALCFAKQRRTWSGRAIVERVQDGIRSQQR
jgi:hypothetical protein